jgi:hypothetical protein
LPIADCRFEDLRQSADRRESNNRQSVMGA